MHNKAVRKYKNLRKTGAFPSQEGFSAVLQCCARGKIGAVADKIVLDYVAASKEAANKEASGKDKAPAWSVPLSDFKLGLEACAEGSRPVEALIICDAMTEVCVCGGRGGGGGGKCQVMEIKNKINDFIRNNSCINSL